MKKRLVKSSDNQVISGVLGGIAEYIGVDPTIVRVVYLILSFSSMGFPGFFLYIVLSILMPSASKKDYSDYGHENRYYQRNNHKEKTSRKEAEKVDEDDWSDF